MNKKTAANLSMIISKTFSGLNMNALKYLLPLWLSPLSGVTVRCVFASLVFWIIGFFLRTGPVATKEKWQMFWLGALGVFGYMYLYQIGLSMTTPVSCSIFTSLQPIWVFIIAVIFFKEKITLLKITGIVIGLGGALLCVSTQKSSHLASDPVLGNLLCLGCSVVYAVYLVLSHRLLLHTGMISLLKYTFTGAAFSCIIFSFFLGFHAPVLSLPIHWKPMLVLLFILIFPTVITYLLLPVGLKYLSTTVVAMYGYLILLVATVVALAIGQDRFSWTQMSALVLICIGVYLVEIAESRNKKQYAHPVQGN